MSGLDEKIKEGQFVFLLRDIKNNLTFITKLLYVMLKYENKINKDDPDFKTVAKEIRDYANQDKRCRDFEAEVSDLR